MLFWDLIRDFFVKYIFGGVTSNGEYFEGLVGRIDWHRDGLLDDTASDVASSLTFPVGYYDGSVQYINLSDWLSTTATIITMVGICIGLFMLVRWFFKIGAGFIGLRG